MKTNRTCMYFFVFWHLTMFYVNKCSTECTGQPFIACSISKTLSNSCSCTERKLWAKLLPTHLIFKLRIPAHTMHIFHPRDLHWTAIPHKKNPKLFTIGRYQSFINASPAANKSWSWASPFPLSLLEKQATSHTPTAMLLVTISKFYTRSNHVSCHPRQLEWFHIEISHGGTRPIFYSCDNLCHFDKWHKFFNIFSYMFRNKILKR